MPNHVLIPSSGLLAQAALTAFWSAKARFIAAKARSDDVQCLIEHIGKGQLKAVMDRPYPLTEVAQAHDYSENDRVRGKLVLYVR